MLRDVLLWAFAAFVVDPFQAELAERLAAVHAPRAVLEQAAGCARAAVPALADRAVSDPWWAVTTGVGVWIGFSPPEAVLRDAAPSVCAPALDAVRPFLDGRSRTA